MLTAEDWQHLAEDGGITLVDYDSTPLLVSHAHQRDEQGRGVLLTRDGSVIGLFNADPVRALIAVANDALPDDDPGKITRAMVNDIRRMQYETRGWEDSPRYKRIADALESYLPPARQLTAGPSQ